MRTVDPSGRSPRYLWLLILRRCPIRNCASELTKWKNSIIPDTLAAAQEEAGDFDAPVKTQLRAIELLTDEQQRDDYRSRLGLYRAKRPYGEAIPRHAPTDEARPRQRF